MRYITGILGISILLCVGSFCAYQLITIHHLPWLALLFMIATSLAIGIITAALLDFPKPPTYSDWR